MQTKNYRPTKAQRTFWGWIRSTFTTCVFCGGPFEELHHVLGAAAKQNHIHIGQYVMLPTCSACNHDNSRMPPKLEQVRIFVNEVLLTYWLRFRELPMSSDELLAIVTWRR